VRIAKRIASIDRQHLDYQIDRTYDDHEFEASANGRVWEMRQQRLQIKRSNAVQRNRLLSTLLTYLPGAWIDPKNNELISLYRLRYKIAMEEERYDTAMIFLNKILEIDPINLEAKLCKGDIYHRCRDYSKAIEQYNKVMRLTSDRQEDTHHLRARAAMSEIMEMLS
jgi:tetratricopeptide (TPR) repeat protein